MKTVLALFFAFLLIIATLQANAETLKVDERRLKAKRQLLNEAIGGGRKVNVGVAPETKDNQPVSHGATSSTSSETTKTDSNTNNDKDETNPNYQSYGHGSGSSPDTHHIYPDDQRPKSRP